MISAEFFQQDMQITFLKKQMNILQTKQLSKGIIKMTFYSKSKNRYLLIDKLKAIKNNIEVFLLLLFCICYILTSNFKQLSHYPNL